MGKGALPIGGNAPYTLTSYRRAIDGSAPQQLPVSLSKAVQKYGYLPNQQKQNNYQKETITTNKKDLSLNDKVLYIFNISEKRKTAAKMEKSGTAKQKLGIMDTKKPASGTPAGHNKN